ncbi:MAG: hypothetical protein IJ306_07120 [Oscillospiraceae bacterium]|nr:hypothetical protein [Oscillospiraceae bacterium]
MFDIKEGFLIEKYIEGFATKEEQKQVETLYNEAEKCGENLFETNTEKAEFFIARRRYMEEGNCCEGISKKNDKEEFIPFEHFDIERIDVEDVWKAMQTNPEKAGEYLCYTLNGVCKVYVNSRRGTIVGIKVLH